MKEQLFDPYKTWFIEKYK